MHILLLAVGPEDYSIEYANALADTAHITVLAPARYFTANAALFSDAMDLRLLDWPRHRSFSNIAFVLRLARLINALKPDVVHFLGEGVTWMSFLAPLLRRHGIVTTMHDISYHPGDQDSRRVPRWFARRLIMQSDRVIVHGDSLRAGAESLFPGIAGKVEVLPHLQLLRYADLARKLNLQRSPGPEIRVLFFGRIFAYKGLAVLIQSIPLVAARLAAIRLIIAGQGESVASYMRDVPDRAGFDIRERHIPDVETAQLFTDADIVVLPYIEASQSGVLAIANAFARAVIVTDVGELGRSVQNGISGLVIAPNDRHALAEAILTLATDEVLRLRLGEAGRDAAQATASPAIIAAQAGKIYERAAKSKPA